MDKRKFGNTGVEIFPLGFGCMRLPLKDANDQTSIDEAKAIEMIRTAIDKGVNYIDTAFPYHGGQSEILVSKALKDGYREKVYIATKSPVWLLKDENDFEKYFNEQLEKLEVSHIDFYLLHALNKERLNTLIKLNVFEKIDKLKKAGKIKFIGFSFHDDYETFPLIIDTYTFDFCQIQLNYLDVFYQAGEKGLHYAHDKGLGVIIMEPLKGGRLLSVPLKIKENFKTTNGDKSLVACAFDYLYDKEEIGIVLSGMSALSEVNENIDIAKNAQINMLSAKQKESYVKAKEIFDELKTVPCTNCKYCIPCPHGVDIPANFAIINDAYTFDAFEQKKKEYTLFFDNSKKASNCVSCKVCHDKCPQNILISDELSKISKQFES